MPVFYEELEGSPEVTIMRREGSARRRVKIFWADIINFANEIFPDPENTGYLYGAAFPGFPTMWATKMAIRPFVEQKPRYDFDDWTRWHDYAEVQVDYSTNTEDQGQEEGGDGNGPGGLDGSAPSGVSFLGHKIHCGGQYLTWPSDAVRWEKPAKDTVSADDEMNAFFGVLSAAMDGSTTTMKIDGVFVPNQTKLSCRVGDEEMLIKNRVSNQDGSSTINVTRAQNSTTAASHAVDDDVTFFSKGTTDAAQKGAGDNVSASVAIPIFEHTISWVYVKNPPWTAIREIMGKVNSHKFAGIPEECGLFLGAECTRDASAFGVRTWKLDLKISEKNLSNDVLEPQGWNYFMRPTGDNAGTFQRLCKKTIAGDDGGPLGVLIQFAMDATQTSMFVDSTAAPLPQNPQFFISIDDGSGDNLEIVAVTAIVSANEWTIIRGVRGTTAKAHNPPGFPPVRFKVFQVANGVYDLADFSDLFFFT